MGDIADHLSPIWMYNDTWKRDDFADGNRCNGHLDGRVLESLENQFREPAIFHPLCGPEQFQILIACIVVILIVMVHSDLHTVDFSVVDGFKLLVTVCEYVSKLAGDMLNQFFVLDGNGPIQHFKIGSQLMKTIQYGLFYQEPLP